MIERGSLMSGSMLRMKNGIQTLLVVVVVVTEDCAD
jgi:hypothetical protein